jgi:beta-glucosidase-like glycosyl hydrolase/CubicO group peptidase (beta-lactamase class C family)
VGATRWADSVLKQMNKEEKIGQLFMVAAYSNRDSSHIKEISKLIKNYNIGGLCFFQGGPSRQAQQTNYYQSISRTPLLISIDAEWGLSMRLDSVVRYPKQMALGAIADNQLIYDFGKETARQLKRIGVHMNFAPVIDVNNNPKNPVINDRSFGEDKYKVAAKGIEYMRGLQDNGVMANAKHFPGHGNTDKDSHLTLPTLNRNLNQLDSIELYPFRELMSRGIVSVMVGHLNVPSLDSTKNTASSISKNIVTKLLKEDLGYTGLVVTDALNMKGVSNFYAPGVVDAKALIAGNDMLLFTENVPNAIVEIKKAIDSGLISMSEIELRVKKILIAKYSVGLNNYQPVSMSGIYEDLNSNEAKLVSMKLYEHAITLLANRDNLIPFKNLEDRNIAAISIGADIDNNFLQMCRNYANINAFALKKDAPLNDFDFLAKNLEQYNTVIVALHDMTRNESKNYSISKQSIDFLNHISKFKNVVLVVFGNAYSLRNFDNQAPIVLAYEENDFTRSLAAQALFGGIAAKGTLPVTASETFKNGDGFIVEKPIRFKYTLPEEAGLCSSCLARIDAIINSAIMQNAMPGCQIVIAKDSKVVYQKSFGNHSYNKKELVRNTDLYDIASLTKIMATNLAVMEMYDHGKLDFRKKLSHYVHYTRKHPLRKNLLVSDLLLHRSGFVPFIPFYKELLTVNDGVPNYNADSTAFYSIKVADKMFLRHDYPELMRKKMMNSEVKDFGKYVYSDINFYLLKDMVEHQYKKGIDQITREKFYAPLGLSTMTYQPLKKFTANRIVPTENDTIFRKQLLDGYVHDQGAAMLGGVAGHAGLFSNANDVAIVMQMLLNNGSYGGETYFKPSTVKKFTAKQIEGNRRGLGFDKPDADPKKSPTCESASLATFGHTGFTGTAAWADPETGLVYVFLSNRINPSVDNKKLIEMNVRTDVQQIIYDALK